MRTPLLSSNSWGVSLFKHFIMELLTGKCQTQFHNFIECHREIWVYLADRFNDLPKCMQHSLMIEFFDSESIICLIGYNSLIKKYYWNIDKLVYNTNAVSTRSEATTAAIQKANEIYNERV